MTKTQGNFTDFVTFSRASGGTYLDSDGLIKTAANNVPRVEYDASGNLKGLLIEEARTNLFTSSEALASSPWFVSSPNITVVANDKVAPDGNQTATKVSAASDFGGILSTSSVGTTIASKSFTVSVWVYADTTFTFDLRTRGTGSVQEPQNTTVSTVAGQWVRVSSTHTFTASADGSTLAVFLYTANFSDTSKSNTLWFWGAQLEVGAFPTSYIPTTGATATRAADICSMATSAFGYNQGAGTIVVDVADLQFGATGYPRVLEIGNSSNGGERINIYVYSALQNYRTSLNTANVVQGIIAYASSITSPLAPSKAALAYKTNDIAAAYGGVLKGTDSTADITGTTYSRATLKIGGATTSTTDQLNGHIKSIRYYPRRLSNAQIQALTA